MSVWGLSGASLRLLTDRSLKDILEAIDLEESPAPSGSLRNDTLVRHLGAATVAQRYELAIPATKIPESHVALVKYASPHQTNSSVLKQEIIK